MKLIRSTALLLCVFLLLGTMPVFGTGTPDLQKLVDGTAAYQLSTISFEHGCEWAIMALARGGCQVPEGSYDRYWLDMKEDVAQHEGNVTAQDAESILERAAAAFPEARNRILIKGKATVTLEAARAFAEAGVDLIGNESQTVGPEDAPMAVHLVLLGAEVVLLEGIRLTKVPEGVFLLNCAPLNLTETDGAPCRAVLMELSEG